MSSTANSKASGETGDETARLEVGVEILPRIRTCGLYNIESYQGHPLRWAANHAEITLPLNPMSLPKSLQARFWGIAPAGGTEFSLSVNGLELLKGRLDGVPIEHTVTLPHLEGTERLLIELSSPGFQVPGDARVLGLAIESIALLQELAR